MAKKILPKASSPESIPGPARTAQRRSAILWSLTISAFSASLFLLLGLVLRHNGWHSVLDQTVVDFFVSIRSTYLTKFLWVASMPGDPRVITPLVFVTTALLILWGLRPGALFFIATMSSEGLIQRYIAIFFARTRPPEVLALIGQPGTGRSFPSGHAWSTMLYALSLGFVLWRVFPEKWSNRVAIIIYIFFTAFTVGVSRVYLGMHWTTDVIGGWLCAVSLSALTAAIYLALVKRFKLKEKVPGLGPRWFQIAAIIIGIAVITWMVWADIQASPLIG